MGSWVFDPPRPDKADGTFLRIISVNDSYKIDNYPQVATAVLQAKAASDELGDM